MAFGLCTLQVGEGLAAGPFHLTSLLCLILAGLMSLFLLWTGMMLCIFALFCFRVRFLFRASALGDSAQGVDMGRATLNSCLLW
jgi:hypothetical protein